LLFIVKLFLQDPDNADDTENFGLQNLPDSPIKQSSHTETQSPTQLIVEHSIAPSEPSPNEESIKLSGCRIIDIEHFTTQILQLANHGPFDCDTKHLKVIREKRVGNKSCLTFRCTFCKVKKTVWTHPDENHNKTVLDINTATVLSTLSTGMTHEMVSQFLGGLNVPSLSQTSFYQIHEEKVEDLVNNICMESMLEAGREEKVIAERKGHFVKIGDKQYPWITVKVDGTWLRRSYKGNYASLMGAVRIILLF
jgi:hypothetical protein